jgi:hypothetical protein
VVGQQVGFTPPATRPCACPPHIGCAPPATESGREAVETSSRQAWIKFQKPPKPATALVYLTEITAQGNFHTKRREKPRLLPERLVDPEHASSYRPATKCASAIHCRNR